MVSILPRERTTLDPLYILCHGISPNTAALTFANSPGLKNRKFALASTITNNPKRAEPKAVAAVVEKLAARFGNHLVTSQAVREQHAHTTTWLKSQPPDAVVFVQETADVQDVVRICAKNRVPVIAFGAGT